MDGFLGWLAWRYRRCVANGLPFYNGWVKGRFWRAKSIIATFACSAHSEQDDAALRALLLRGPRCGFLGRPGGLG
jgi:hypothetical protein